MISVLIPAYNAEAYVEAALRSVLDQVVDDLVEIIVMDDGSTDGTGDIVARLAQGHPRLRLLRSANGGVSRARNALIAALDPDSQFVTFLDADDAFPPGRLARDLALFHADPELEVVYGQLRLVADTATDLSLATQPDDVCVRGISVSIGTYRRSVIGRNGGFDPSFTHGEDLDYLLRIFERQPKRVLLDAVSVLYRQHAGGASRDGQSLRRGVMRAMLFHGRRLRDNPALARVDGLFAMGGPADTAALPSYSVIIPAYNAAAFLRETIASVRAQTHPAAEIIVVDDGSTDDTLAVLAETPHVRVIHQENRGPGAATNAGIAAAQSEYLAFLDADDQWLPDKMAQQFAHLALQPALSVVFCRMTSFADDGTALKVEDAQSGFARSTLLVSRAVFDRVGPIADLGLRAGEMIDWIARAREAGIHLAMIETPLAKRRLHHASMTARSNGLAADYVAVAKQALRRKRDQRKGAT